MSQMQMQQHVTAVLTQRFDNESQYGAWWAYLTDAGNKYASYKEPNIPLNQPLNLIVEPKGGGKSPVIKEWSPIDGTAPSAVQQTEQQQAYQQRQDEVARGKTRCSLVAPLGVALFQELPPEQRTISAACEIADALLAYVFND